MNPRRLGAEVEPPLPLFLGRVPPPVVPQVFVEIVRNEVWVHVSRRYKSDPWENFVLRMSLARHSYRNCVEVIEPAGNNLYYSTVEDSEIMRRGEKLGSVVGTLLNGGQQATRIARTTIRVPEGQNRYFVNWVPGGTPILNHYYPTGGDRVWANMTTDQYVAACRLRRLELILAKNRKYENKEKVFELWDHGSPKDPVRRTFERAVEGFQRLPLDVDPQFSDLSNKPKLVTLVRQLGAHSANQRPRP